MHCAAQLSCRWTRHLILFALLIILMSLVTPAESKISSRMIKKKVKMLKEMLPYIIALKKKKPVPLPIPIPIP